MGMTEEELKQAEKEANAFRFDSSAEGRLSGWITELSAEVRRLRSEVEQLEKKLAEAVDDANEPCPFCGGLLNDRR